MKHIKDIYPLVKEVRQRIIETMKERGITKITLVPSMDEWLEQNPDKYEEDYDTFRFDNAPRVIYFTKYDTGYEYEVLSVELIGKDALSYPCFRMECEASELGSDTFTDDEVYEMINVYEALEKHLGIDDEPEKVLVLYEVDEEDNTKTSIVAMSEADWRNRKPETIEKVLRDYFDERYSDCDDDYFCYDDEIRQAVEALTTGYEAEFNGDSVFWDEVEMI